MERLIRSAIIVDPNSKHNGKKRDILIKNGVVDKIGNSLNAKAKTIEAEDLFISPGWFDLKVNFCEPGYEFKEDLNTGIAAAKSGGFTGAAHSPFLDPVISTRSQVEYLRDRAKNLHFDLRPIGSLTQGAAGKVISEMYDMHLGGAAAFSDLYKEVSSGIMLKALQYVTPFKGLIISMPLDHSIAGNAYVHEGKTSASIGLPGIPAMAEEIRIKRDLELLEHSNSKLHFSGISSAKGIDLIKKAKKKGVAITADVHFQNLVFNDESILDFDSNKKIFPPARSESDRKALIKAVKDGTIDVIVSDHRPENIESKDLEFEYAEFGIGAISTMYSVLTEYGIDRNLFVSAVALKPRAVLGIEIPTLEEGSKAEFTLFQEGKEWTATAEKSKSRSKNDPFLNTTYSNKVLGTIFENEFYLNA
ncbi:MAG: dihydroorotase [Flavobacteriales bacterium]|nr:dihydroorotase [Flavobacteriales bacterium]